MSKDAFYIIGLFDFDADADCIDRGLDQDLLILVAGDMHWIQDDLSRGSGPLAGKSDKEGRYLASTSGMLCRSTTWLEKFSRHSAAVRLARTQLRYGRSVFA